VLATRAPDSRLAGTWPLDDLEVRGLAATQRAARRPGIRAAAVALSRAGEHAGAWIALGATAAVVDRARSRLWARATTRVVVAHAASVVLKRVVRRRRPDDPRLRVLAGTPSRWSFPSSHATSTTTAAVTFGRLLGTRVPLALVPAMVASRAVLGVHYPSDLVAGVVLGRLVAGSPGPDRTAAPSAGR
jgi:membrane-associated phospholipid phosphatase